MPRITRIDERDPELDMLKTLCKRSNKGNLVLRLADGTICTVFKKVERSAGRVEFRVSVKQPGQEVRYLSGYWSSENEACERLLEHLNQANVEWHKIDWQNVLGWH